MQGPPQQYDAGLAGLGHSRHLLHTQIPQKDLSLAGQQGTLSGLGGGGGQPSCLNASPGVSGAG